MQSSHMLQRLAAASALVYSWAGAAVLLLLPFFSATNQTTDVARQQ